MAIPNQSTKGNWTFESALFRLRNNCDSSVWDDVVKTLETFSQEFTVAVTEAPPEKILVAQGQAQMARKVLMMFKDAGNRASKPTPSPPLVP